MQPSKKLLTLPLLLGLLQSLAGCSEEREQIETAVLYVAAGTQETTALAGFYGEGFGASNCLQETIDRCVIATCLDGGAIRTYVDGGKVEFRGDELEATLDTGAVVDANDDTGPGLAVATGLPALSDNETITMTLSGGGTVSAAAGSVTLPERLELVEPVIEEPSCQAVDPADLPALAIASTDDFVVRWSSNSLDAVDVLFFFEDIANWTGDEERQRFTSIRCLYTADEEEASIPEAVVEQMPTGVRGTFSVRHIVSNAELIGNWSITFGGYWELCSPLEVE